ncbi:glycosyltransferase involved in cell wall biosynthesis [Aeromicrobium panaciterrae]|uniref:Glycosyltransferase involved in cell wall biosynthesis n=1 Tax=Aeromicrobium panaciterrae TaxID=363861 RepID=A0ABU1UKM0_9ACTN|nr:glycosyltransferase family 4 protein [Aeromicrobium panaciterrae]MDR7085711.1 glycosyltransferase involved in cell wall biosynthesis [Aeromicrobium panaciterrae]
MRVIVHDFSGHPFQAELSRKLASSGLEVEHASSAQYVSGKGHLERQPGDASTLSFNGISLPMEFEKYSPLARLKFERRYGRKWIKQLKAKPADAVIACNLPLITMYLFSRFAKRTKLPYVMWHQDIYSAGLSDELRRKLPRPFAALGGKLFERMEAYCTRNASHVVAIGDAFKEVYPGWKVSLDKVSVIPNWAPLDKVFPVGRVNRRSSHLFDEETSLRLVYAGTIGRKHNPSLLIELLRTAIDDGIPASLVVVSEGEAADELAAIAAAEPTLPLRVLPFQPADVLPDVLGSADVLVALLEPEATKFSIPSKVLSYMAAGRPILGLMPEDNPAAADIVATGGHVAPPTTEGARETVSWLAPLHADRALVTKIGKQSREVAEAKFDVDKVCAEFNEILEAITPKVVSHV